MSILINAKTSLIIINSPSNPTGGIIPKDEIDKLIKGLENYPNTMLMSDEIYDQFCFGETHFTSILNYPSIRDRLIILNGWSKTYAMTGWRLGYGVFPDTLIDAADKLAVNVHSCVNASAQYAALEALNGPQDCVTMMNKAFKIRSKIMFEELNKLDLISCNNPQGAFYCFPNISKLNFKTLDLVSRLDAMQAAFIEEPDDMLMEALIIKLFNDRQILIKPNIVNFLMQRIERSYLGVAEIIDLIDKVSLSKKKSVSISLIKGLIN